MNENYAGSKDYAHVYLLAYVKLVRHAGIIVCEAVTLI